MSTIGFIILRHVSDEKTNKLWNLSYKSIRTHYPENIILIIDDNSDYNFVKNEQERELHNTVFINSEYKKRGELLPIYYYLHNELFDIAVIIHDSLFINSYIDFNVETYKFLFEFDGDNDNETDFNAY